MGVPSNGAGAAMRDIEILPDEAGAPTVILHGDAAAAAQSKGITRIHISLSHSEVRQTADRRSVRPLTLFADRRRRFCAIHIVILNIMTAYMYVPSNTHHFQTAPL